VELTGLGGAVGGVLLNWNDDIPGSEGRLD
jgi:hypothetical protein